MFIKKGNRYVRLFYLCFNCNYCNCWSITLKDIPIDLEALIHALGGIDNIKESQSQGSKVRFFVENDDLVKVNVLKELGASGVIQATGKVTVILGKFSDEISRIVNEKK